MITLGTYKSFRTAQAEKEIMPLLTLFKMINSL